jgi:hypothetical protein
MKERVEAISEFICKIAVGVLIIFLVVVSLIRGVGFFIAIGVMFARSPLPWWILAPAALFLVMGFAYLFKRLIDRRRLTRTVSKRPRPACCERQSSWPEPS